MEYRRRRRRKKRSAAASGGAKAVAALLFAGLVIYFISASPVADWLSGNVVEPVFSGIRNALQPQTAPPAALPEATPAAQAAASEQTVSTTEITPPALTLYALQMGVYAQADNAKAQAASIQERGAAGYVLEDAGRYRVLAAAYQDEASLKTVREQLSAQGMESAAYTMTGLQPKLKVTALGEQAAGLQAAFLALYEAEQALCEQALRFDAETRSVSEGQAAVQEIASALAEAQAAFSGLAQADSPVLAQLAACYADCREAMTALTTDDLQQSTVDYSAKMKYTHLYMADRYLQLMKHISTQT